MPDVHTAAPAATPAQPRPTPDPLDIPPGFDRHRDALAIVDTGACNPAGITRKSSPSAATSAPIPRRGSSFTNSRSS